MKIFTKAIFALLFIVTAFSMQNVNGQSILNPGDTVYTYNANATKGSSTNPNQPAAGVIGKWIKTTRMSWNTSEWKCYVFNGMPFRLHYPHTYVPGVVDGKKYPIMIFYHGAGESGPVTDNEISMAHGGLNPFQNVIDNGTFDGYIMIPQSPFTYWDPSYETYVKLLTDYMITNNKLDPFHIITNGLSAGGSAVWDMQFRYPSVMSASMPMSSNNQGNATQTNLQLSKYTPIWTWQGGLDTWPDPFDAGIVNANEIAAGSDYKYQIYPTLGHDTWDNAWAEPDFFPFALRSYSSNPWPLHGQSAFCPGVAISDTLGVAPGFSAYQWRMNGNALPNTGNSIIVTALGTYDCRVQRNGLWSDWSRTPVVISTRQPTVTPPITTAGLASVVIPSPSNPGVTLQVPTGYASYTWQKVGSNTTVSSANTLSVTAAGQYIVEVTQTGGCSSTFSPPFTVIPANGPNAPDPASGLIASPVSQTSILLTWNQNPTPTNNETGFEIYQASKSGGPYTLVAITGADVSKDTVTGLNAASKYYYIIRAVDNTAASANSNEASTTTIADTQPPTPPGSLTVTGTTYNSVALSWTAATDNVAVVGYDIYVNGVKSYGVPANQTNFTVYSLTNGQTYSFFVKARDLAGNASTPSNQVSGEALLNGIPYNYYNGLNPSQSVLPNFSQLSVVSSGILPNFSLAPGAADVVQFGLLFQGSIIIPTTGTYTFETNSDDGSMMWLGSLGSNASPYIFGTTPLVNNDGLHGGQNRTSSAKQLTAGIYPFAVAFFQQGGGSGLSVLWKTPGSNTFVAIPNSAFAQTPVVNGTAPNAPSNLVATAQSYKAIGLTWNDNSPNETGFEVYRSNNPSNTGAVIIGTTGPGATSYIDSTVSASTKYFYEVRAVNLYGSSIFTSNYTEAEFKFNGNFNDSTGNGHTLTAIGSPTFDAANVQEGVSSVKLNGTNQALTINNTPASFLQESYFQRTIACWVKASGTSGANRVIWDIGGSTNGLSLVLNNTTLTAAIASASSRKSITSTLNNTNWNHIAVVYYGDSLMLYVNGVLTASNLALGFHSIGTTTDGARIGQTNGTNALNTTGGFFGGNIDDFGVYNTALTPDAIQTLMNFGFGQSNATSQPLPAIPAAPTALVATPTSAAGIKVTWTNNAVNASGIQIYRSNNNNQNYILLAVLAPNAIAYQDSGLFASATYYYKVNAVNPGGASAYSNEGSAVTLDIPPVIAQITGLKQARYGTTTTIAVSATRAAAGVITLTGSNLPAFAQFTDNGNGTGKITLNPAQTDSGTYNNLTVTASDAFGGTSQTQFSLWVNNNYPPTLDSIASYTMNEGDTVTVALNGHNVNATDTLAVLVSGLPTSYTLTTVANGSATLQLTPNYAAAGTFPVTVTVNDNNGLSTSRVFTLVVNKKDPITRIYTRVKYQATAPAPWNNLNGPVTTNLLDQNGNVTPVGIAFNPTTWWMPYNGGANTGNNSGVYPDVVLEEYYYFSFFGGPANPTVVLSGLNTNKKYDITFFGSSSLNIGADNGITTYTIGNQTVQLGIQNNTQNTVAIDTVTPASDGTITVTLGKLIAYPPGYLNAIVIANHYDDGTTPAAAKGLTATVASHGVNLGWNDVAYNETSYQVYRSTTDSLHYSLIATLQANSQSYNDTAVSGSTLYYYKVNAVDQYGTGPYSNPASVTSPDRVPQVNPIANVTMSNTQPVQVQVSAVDDPTDQLTLTASGLPAFASFADNGNGTGTITFTPTPGLQGAFQNLTITATDLSDSSRSASFNLNVVDPNIAYTYVNITTPDHQAPAPWNNLTAGYIPYAGTAFVNLQSQTGAPTGITVTMTDGWGLVAETGMKRRNGSDLYPEAVSGSSFFAQDNNVRRITITGLNTALGYNFQFFISHNTSQSTLTHFTINGQSVVLNGSQNSNKTAQINGITPDNTGTVVISCQKDTSAMYAMLSALIIQSYTPGGTLPFAPADLRVADYSKTGTIALQWQDRASNETGYEVWRAPAGGSYAKLVTLAANATTYVDTATTPNTAYNYIVRAINLAGSSAYSNPVKGYTYASAVFVFFNRVWAPPYNFPSAPAPFNNLNWIYQALGTVWNNFTDENGLPTNIGMVQPVEWDEVDPFGASTGNNSGLFPDVAMDQGWLDFVGDSSYVTITGLDASKKYDISVFASCTDDGTANSSAVYRINGQAGILNAHQNTSGNLTFFGITPDANGNVSIGVNCYDSSNSSFAILGNLVVKGYTPNTSGITQAPSEAAVTTMGAQASTFNGALQTLDNKLLTAFPNPFRQFFNLTVPAADHDNIMVSIADAAGRTVYESRFDNLVQGDNTLRIQPASLLPSGVYFATVLYVNSGERKLIKMIRN